MMSKVLDRSPDLPYEGLSAGHGGSSCGGVLMAGLWLSASARRRASAWLRAVCRVVLMIVAGVLAGPVSARADSTVDSIICLNGASGTLSVSNPTPDRPDISILTWSTNMPPACNTAGGGLVLLQDGSLYIGGSSLGYRGPSGSIPVPSQTSQWILRIETAQGSKDLATQPTTVTINWNETHQTIDGFGGAQPDEAAAVLAHWPEPERSQILDLEFSDLKGIGLTLLRTQVEARLESSLGIWNYEDDDQVYIMKQALARGPVKLFGSVWSPPAWTKDNHSTIGGGLDSAYEQAYADYLSHYASEYARANGVNIYAVSIQNEPDTSGVPWDTCRWNSLEIAGFLANYLSPTFAANGITTKVIAPEAADWDHVEFSDPDEAPFMTWVYSNPAALGRVDIVAGHTYGGDLERPFQKALDAGKKIWQTEASPGGLEPVGQTVRDIDGALIWAKKIHDSLTGAQASAWLWFILATYPEGSLIQLNGSDHHSFLATKTFWALGNFSKFIRPGFVRIGATMTPSPSLYTSAYKDPVSGQLVIVAINQDATAARVKFNTGFAATATPYVTSASDAQNLTPQADVSLGQAVTIPGKSIVTFVAPPPPDSAPPVAVIAPPPSVGIQPASLTKTRVGNGVLSVTATAAITDGQPPFTYSWIANGPFSVHNPTDAATSVSATLETCDTVDGEVVLTVTDAGGRQAQATAPVYFEALLRRGQLCP